ncbi:putative tail tape measure protein [Pseudomonas phage UAntarctica]|nr:putative tail tape measure protein [Pseudomonas phage UAntarctica]
MAQFEVDFSESLSQLAQFQIRLANMGQALDNMEAKAGKTTSASSQLLRTMNSEYDKLEKILVSAGADAERLGATMQTVRNNVNMLMSGMAAQNLKATVQAQAYNGELAELGRLLNDTASKNTYTSWQQKTQQLTNKLTAENEFLRASITATSTELGKSNANLKTNLTHKQNLATADQRLRNTGDNLVLTLASLSKEQGQSNVMTQAYISARKAQITEDVRAEAKLQELNRTLASLSGGTQEQIAVVQQMINVRKQDITEGAREDTQLRRLRETLASLSGGRQEEIARVQAQINARKQVINESMTERKVVDELTAAIKREEGQLVRLQAQSQLTSSAHGRRVQALREEIAEQTRLNQLMSMSTGRLLGFGNAQQKVNVAQELGSQSAAMLRAGLQGAHASVGMYTSSTILAATATYGIAAAMRDSITTGAEFYATMSRTRAVMSTGDASESWLTNAAQSSKALEMQVRALGQTTIFTASEVGDGLQQLGMAGLSANEALVALKPSLQLANLANVSMARSADISTNVLMTFGMQAKELQGVVDLMATAVNNSNADIEQLANSLSYAGPAAKTAGFSIQDTTAAIETMANSGIKGSRSGSALRRMFTSLLNPTKKGQEVIQKYGLDILDAEGNTRSLSNIVGQLSKAMKDLPGPERLAAITNLVGVYASSAVTGLVDNAGQFAKFAEQNMNVSGAGDRMEKIIADNLKFDWKEMLSSVEELQLQAFSQLDGRLRQTVAGLSKYILDMMEPYKEGTDITGVDRLLVQAQTTAEAFGRIVAGIVAYKFASGNVFGAFSADAKAASERLTLVADRAKVTSAGLAMMGSSADGTRTRIDMLTAAQGRSVAIMGGMANAAALGARGLSALAAAASIAMRALGWVGLIYGIGSAIYSVFSKNTDEEVLRHRDEVDKVRSSYDDLKAAIEETGLARQRAALKTQIGADKQGAQDLQDQIQRQTNLIAAGKARGVSEEDLQPLNKRLEGLQSLVGAYEAKVTDSEASLAKLGTTTNDYVTEAGHQEIRLQNLINLTDQLSRAQGTLDASTERAKSTGLNNIKAQQEVVRLTQEKQLAEQQLKLGTGQLLKTQAQVRPFSETLDSLRGEQEAAAQAKIYKKTTPLTQQLADKEDQITKAREDQLKLTQRDDAAREAGNTDMRVGLGLAEASVKNLASLEAERLVLQGKVTGQETALTKAREAAAAVTRSDQENLIAHQRELSDINEKIKAAEAPGGSKVADAKELTRLYNDQARVLGQIKGLEKKDTKAGEKSQKQDDQQAATDLRTYTTLAKKFDAVSASQLELQKGTESMQRLRAAGTITIEQETKAMGELRLAHYLAIEALDKNYIALEKLRTSYGESPFGIAATDLAVLNKGIAEGTVKIDEYNRVYAQIRTKQKDQATSGLPTANLKVGEASSSPFTDWVSTEVDRAQGLSAFQKRQDELDASYTIQMAANERERATQLEHLNAMQLDQETHAQKMLEIETRYGEDKTAIIVTAGEQQNAVTTAQAQYAEQMSTMALMAAMGTVQNVLGTFASASADASAAQKAAFVAQKALAIAQIIIYTELAAAQAMAIPGDVTKVIGISLASFIRATGYASAGLVAAQAIGSLASGGKTSTTMYDTGGYIPYNRVGIVGEYGPELVQGPAHVTGRGNSAGKLNSGGSGDTPAMQITLAPVIQVSAQPGATAGDAQMVAQTVKALTTDTLQDMVRPNGFLDNWYRSKVGK